MLTDATFSSPWSSEVLIFQDFKLPAIQDSDDDELFDLYKRSHLESLSGSSSQTTASECSTEDLYADGDDDGFVFDIDGDSGMQGLEANLNDLIDTSTMVNWNEEDGSSTTSSSSVETWLPLSKTEACQAFTCSVPASTSSVDTWSPLLIPEASQAFTCSVPSSAKCHSCRLKKSPCKKWSHMTKAERSRTIDELSLMISNELSIKEQMDIIKIINPSARFSKHKTEFVIDLNVIDDAKLEKIQDILNFHCVLSPDLLDNNHCHSSNKKFPKKNKSQDRRPKVDKQRVQKEYRQKLKERRSGLFVKEERLAVSETIVEEEIDVLG